jgi:putative transposase
MMRYAAIHTSQIPRQRILFHGRSRRTAEQPPHRGDRSPPEKLSTVQQSLPFETVAVCVLPDHIHCIWALPEGDANFATRWGRIKSGFSRGLDPSMSRSASKVTKREKGIWQRRYWEHAIRDDADLERHVDYIHFNPVKHGHVTRVTDWPHSSFHRYVEGGLLAADWGGDVKDTRGAFGE